MSQRVSRKDFNSFDRLVRRMRSGRARRYTRSGDRVIDVGCGQQNWLVNSVSEWAPDSLGIDPHLRPEFRNRKGSTETLDEVAADPSRRFDTAISLAVIEHLETHDAPEHLAQIRRCLRPDGRLVITTPPPRSKPVLEFLSFRLRLISPDEISDHKYYYSLAEIQQLVDAAGFDVLQAKSFHLGFNQVVIARRRSDPGEP